MYAEVGRQVLTTIAQASIALSGFLLLTAIFMMDRQRDLRRSLSKKERRAVLILIDIPLLAFGFLIPFYAGLQISFESVSLLARLPSVGLLEQTDVDRVYNLLSNFKMMLIFVATGMAIWLIGYGSIIPHFTSAGKKN